jgi:hypothetical protein
VNLGATGSRESDVDTEFFGHNFMGCVCALLLLMVMVCAFNVSLFKQAKVVVCMKVNNVFIDLSICLSICLSVCLSSCICVCICVYVHV